MINGIDPQPVSLVTPEIRNSEQVLQQALKMGFRHVAILGEMADGKFYILSSPMSHADMNWYFDKAKTAIIPQPKQQMIRP